MALTLEPWVDSVEMKKGPKAPENTKIFVAIQSLHVRPGDVAEVSSE
jgi:hypothetical protein